MKTSVCVFVSLRFGVVLRSRAQGSLTPSGAPAPTMKSLDQVEPRTPVSVATSPGNADSLFKITQAGSYYLTGNVTGVAAKHGIEIAADRVTLDLMGFSLNGVGGSPDGVFVSLSNRDRIVVRNGKAANWGGDGVDVFTTRGCRVEDIQVSGNGGAGIRAGFNATVLRVTSYNNGGDGILADEGSTVAECTAQGNTGDGIDVDFSSTVRQCAALANGEYGIRADNDCSIRQCDAQMNVFSGIGAANGCTIENCVANKNQVRGITAGYDGVVSGCTARENLSDGIAVGGGGAVRDCQVAINGEDGIEVADHCLVRGNNGLSSSAGTGIRATGTGAKIEGNHVAFNLIGLHVTRPGNEIAGNTVKANTDNYDFAPGNRLDLLLSEIPETIDWPATVKLTGSLTGNPGGITIRSGDVTVDLMGFAVVGGTGDGILVSGIRTNIAIRNGTVRGWSGMGIRGINAVNCEIERLAVSANTGSGIAVSDGSVVNDCVVQGNGGGGIFAGFGATMSACTAQGNTGFGISAGAGATVSGCAAQNNTGYGIAIGGGGTLTGCTAQDNGYHGIYAGSGSVISGCAAKDNDGVGISADNGSRVSGCSVSGNEDSGVRVVAFCMVEGNTATYNGNSGGAGTQGGIHATANGNRIENNLVTQNDADGILVVASAIKNVVIRNTCYNNAGFQFRIPGVPGQPPAGANVVGAIVGDATNVNANAWANFQP